jgi:nucleoside-diphosphate-sugar epimerase
MDHSPVLVTGGFGAMGAWVVRRLVQVERRSVVVYSRHDRRERLGDLAASVAFEVGDVMDRRRLSEVVGDHRVRRIVHTAAALLTQGERDPISCYGTNVMGGLNVFDVAREHGVERVVFTSGKGQYGALEGPYGPPTYQAVDEDYKGPTVHVYGSSKRALEDAARHCRRLWGLDIIALRLGSTYGPGKGDHGGYAGEKGRIVQAALRGEPYTVRTPEVVDDLVYVRDVAKGHALALFAPATEHWQFNISGGQLVSLREFAAEVARLCPQHRLTLMESAETRVATNVTGLLSIERARAELGYAPDFPGVAGVADYLGVLRQAVPAAVVADS